MQANAGKINFVLNVPIAQWTERQPPELEVTVRVRLGTPKPADWRVSS